MLQGSTRRPYVIEGEMLALEAMKQQGLRLWIQLPTGPRKVDTGLISACDVAICGGREERAHLYALGHDGKEEKSFSIFLTSTVTHNKH